MLTSVQMSHLWPEICLANTGAMKRFSKNLRVRNLLLFMAAKKEKERKKKKTQIIDVTEEET